MGNLTTGLANLTSVGKWAAKKEVYLTSLHRKGHNWSLLSALRRVWYTNKQAGFRHVSQTDLIGLIKVCYADFVIHKLAESINEGSQNYLDLGFIQLNSEFFEYLNEGRLKNEFKEHRLRDDFPDNDKFEEWIEKGFETGRFREIKSKKISNKIDEVDRLIQNSLGGAIRNVIDNWSRKLEHSYDSPAMRAEQVNQQIEQGRLDSFILHFMINGLMQDNEIKTLAEMYLDKSILHSED